MQWWKNVRENFRKLGWRGGFFAILAILSYLSFFYLLFIQGKLLYSILPWAIFFLLLSFLAIDLRKFKKIGMMGFFGLIFLLFFFFVPPGAWQLLVVLLLSLLAVLFTLASQRAYFSKVRKISWMEYFTRGGGVFALLSTLLYAFALIGFNASFPLSCDQIFKFNDRVIQASLAPVEQTEAMSKSLFHQIKGFFITPEVELDLQAELEELLPTEELGLALGWDELEGNLFQKISQSFSQITTNITHEVKTTQREVNLKICNSIISQIKKIYEHSTFQLGVIFLLYLLFIGVVRMLVAVIGYVGYAFFLLLKLLGAYPTHKVMEEVEELK